MIIRVRNVSYHFEIYQAKDELPYLVMLHGFMGSGRNFEHLISDLKSFCNPVTVDLLGHGKSEGAELHYRFSTKEQVADLTKLIREQLPIPVYLYGYSMGGRLALQLALHRPDLYKGLILESSTFGIESESERQARQALDAKRSDDLSGNFKGFLEQWNEMPLFKSSTADPELLDKVRLIQEHQNPFWMANCLQGFGTGTMPCVRDRLSELIIPVLLLAGEFDSKFVHLNRVMEKEIRDAKLQVVKDAGHRVHLDKPDALALLLQSFLQG
jgi:2-succinyl-6-hydroxy-2,4-cyclohexadiene-1-carboxylate synthase